MKAMRYDIAPIGEIDSYIENPLWVFQQKLDGVRLMAHVTRGQVEFLGDGTPIKFAAAAQWFDALRPRLEQLPDCVLDGELLIENGEYWLFDLPYFDGIIEPDAPQYERRAALVTLADVIGLPIVPESDTEESKRALWDTVVAANGEGVVAKAIDAPYEPGARSTGVLKFKITYTADVVVLEVNRPDHRTGNFRLGIGCCAELGWEGELIPGQGLFVEVGQCSAIGKPDVKVGDVIEVEFACVRDLTRPRLLMPRMTRPRPDKSAADCDFDQIRMALATKAVLIP